MKRDKARDRENGISHKPVILGLFMLKLATPVSKFTVSIPTRAQISSNIIRQLGLLPSIVE